MLLSIRGTTLKRCCYISRSHWGYQPTASRYSNSALSPEELTELLSKPSWSVKSLQATRDTGKAVESISKNELHHLLRLSALPPPKTTEEEAAMIETLESQLHFVRAIQTVDTTGIEPLQSIRDETEQAEKDTEITLESMRAELKKEQTGGFARRITRKGRTVDTSDVETGNPLGQARRIIGRFIAVDTKRS